MRDNRQNHYILAGLAGNGHADIIRDRATGAPKVSRKGAVAQLVRVPDCRSGGCGFESRPRRLGCRGPNLPTPRPTSSACAAALTLQGRSAVPVKVAPAVCCNPLTQASVFQRCRRIDPLTAPHRYSCTSLQPQVCGSKACGSPPSSPSDCSAPDIGVCFDSAVVAGRWVCPHRFGIVDRPELAVGLTIVSGIEKLQRRYGKRR